MRPCLCSLPLSRAALRAARSPPPASSSLHHGPKSSAGASEIPLPTAALPLLETHAPPCARPSPPSAVCCSPHTPRAPCMNTPPKSPGHTSRSAPAQTRAPQCRTPNISAGHALRIPAPDLVLHFTVFVQVFSPIGFAIFLFPPRWRQPVQRVAGALTAK